jgi:hypothetical protein
VADHLKGSVQGESDPYPCGRPSHGHAPPGILDDIPPLRQLNAKVVVSEAHLFQPQVAYRVRNNVTTDIQPPPEESAGQNPPDGAIINHNLKSAATGPVTLEIFDDQDRLVRRFASTDAPGTCGSPLFPPTFTTMALMANSAANSSGYSRLAAVDEVFTMK